MFPLSVKITSALWSAPRAGIVTLRAEDDDCPDEPEKNNFPIFYFFVEELNRNNFFKK